MSIGKHWKIIIAAVVIIGVAGIIGYKEWNLGSIPKENEQATLQDRINDLRGRKQLSVVAFYVEPTSFCCEGTRLQYVDLKQSTMDLMDQINELCPYLFVEVNYLTSPEIKTLHSFLKKYPNSGFNSILVFDAKGTLLKEFDSSEHHGKIVDYIREVRG